MIAKKRPTIKDIARRANTSIGTVSRLLNGHNVNPETGKRINSAIAKLGYRPSMFARGIRGIRKHCVGILIEKRLQEDDPWLQKLTLALFRVFSEQGHRCMLEICDSSTGQLPTMLFEVDGCALIGKYEDPFFIAAEKQNACPLVTYSERMLFSKGVSLQVDYEPAIRDAIKTLLALGHTTVGFLTMSLDFPSARQRFDAYRSCLSDFGAPFSMCQVLETASPLQNAYAAGAAGTPQLLRNAPNITAIIYASDFLALGGMQSLWQQGKRIPADISVVGFDDVSLGRVVDPGLATISVDHYDLARMLLAGLESLWPNGKDKKETQNNARQPIPAKFIHRQSIGKPTN